MNRIPAHVVSVETHGSITLVEAAAGLQHFTATMVGNQQEMAGWRPGIPVTLLFKETEVSLAKNLSGEISMRNRFPATIVSIARGRLLARVVLSVGGHIVESVITTRSSHALSLAVGDTVEGLVKANEMTVIYGDTP